MLGQARNPVELEAEGIEQLVEDLQGWEPAVVKNQFGGIVTAPVAAEHLVSELQFKHRAVEEGGEFLDTPVNLPLDVPIAVHARVEQWRLGNVVCGCPAQAHSIERFHNVGKRDLARATGNRDIITN